MNENSLVREYSYKYLGVTVDEDLSWSNHVDNLISKISQRLGLLRRVKHLLPVKVRKTLYNSLVLPLFDYSDLIWGDKNNKTVMDYLQVQQNKAAKLIIDAPPMSSASEALAALNWKPLSHRRYVHRCILIFKCINNLINYDFNLTFNSNIHAHNTRSKSHLHLPRVKTNWGKQKLSYQASKDFNSLDLEICDSVSLSSFKSKLI